jgi:RNase H-fold protein (predicted Holliday junction resolvase)
MLILALDPGERKIGWALVEADGTPVAQGIWPVGEWSQRMLQLPRVDAVTTLVIGDGTARMNIQAELKRLLPQCAIAVVGEKESTVEGWQLKRAELSRGNPLKSLVLTVAQLFHAPPVDDYAARVLARRYLAQR